MTNIKKSGPETEYPPESLTENSECSKNIKKKSAVGFFKTNRALSVQKRRIAFSPFGFLCLLPPALFLAISLSWYHRAEPDVYLGFLQGDQPSYTALAKSVFNRGNGLFYANPFDYDNKAPRVLSNLGYVALGWLMKAFGNHEIRAWEFWRLLWGTLGGIFYVIIVQNIVPHRSIRRWAIFAGLFGGGTAWLHSLFLLPETSFNGWLTGTIDVERDYGWWCLNFFRQSLYPLELLYHSLFFLAIILYMRRNLRALIYVIAALWWTHVITAILTTTVVGLALAVDYLQSRKRDEIYAVAGLGVVVSFFVLYYNVALPRYPSVASWMEQTLQFRDKMAPGFWLPAYGFLLPAGIICFFPEAMRRLLQKRHRRIVLIWGIAAVGWTYNDIFFSRCIQPIHFSRGYVYLFLVLLASFAMMNFIPRSFLNRRIFGIILAVSLIPLCLDNVLFLARVGTNTPQKGLLTISKDAEKTLNYFKQLPGSKLVFSADQKLGVLIVAQTQHRVYASEMYLTPFYTDRMNELTPPLIEGDMAALKRMNLEYLVFFFRGGNAPCPWMNDAKRFNQLFRSGEYRVGNIP